jgi:prepilin-type N-terminal cleavage/methylation domain-containing protein
MIKAFTLVELIIAILVISILAAIAYPIYMRSIAKSKESACVTQLQQLQAAIAIYQENNGGAGKYGAGEQMGLPRSFADLVRLGLIKMELLRCKGNPGIMGGKYAVYTQMFSWSDNDFAYPPWKDYCFEHKDESISVIDLNHGNEGKPMGARRVTFHLLGVYLDGHVATITKKGDFANRELWNQ